MPHVTLKVTLTLTGPILTQSTTTRTPGIDAPMARDAHDRFYLPRSLVRGRLRQSWTELATVNLISTKMIEDLLGPEHTDRDKHGLDPQRARLRFDDFVHEVDPTGDRDRRRSDLAFRIRIDEARGAVVNGAMLVLESPFGAGEPVKFVGQVRYFAEDETCAKEIHEAVEMGLRWTTSLGAERTVGFGDLIGVEIEPSEVRFVAPAQPPAMTAAAEVGEILGLVIRIADPFCVSKRVPIGNIFESDTVLSGGVVRGALATHLKSVAALDRTATIDGQIVGKWQSLGKAFDCLRMSHAFPTVEGDLAYCRPATPPLSLVKADFREGTGKRSEWFDVALCQGPTLLGKPSAAPAFAIDWKWDGDVKAHFGWAEPPRELRVRTAIDPAHRRAREGQLFAYEMVVPGGFAWLARLDLGDITDKAERAEVVERLGDLLAAGPMSVGKTKARATVELLPAHAVAPKFLTTSEPIDGHWVVTLQTPALLCDPNGLDEESGEKKLRDAYQAAWDGLSGHTVEVVRFFASQTLAGGYQALRFQGGKSYNPFLLTDAGSVFVLAPKAGCAKKAQEAIAGWMRRGLPMPGWASDPNRYGDSWRTCPFRPQDGFGEVAVNLPCHSDRKPAEETIHGLD